MNQSAYSAYAQSSFGGIESPTKLIEMLYDGIYLTLVDVPNLLHSRKGRIFFQYHLL